MVAESKGKGKGFTIKSFLPILTYIFQSVSKLNYHMINLLKFIFSALLVFMCYKVISTSLESNLFEQWNFLGSIPWMRATLWDFYANIFIITLWMFYKEKSIILKISIAILFVCLGSIATLAYVLVYLFKLKDGDGVKELLLKREV
ncbi:Protein of unknown function [Pedobacter suwonensis]|uniref:DUF1475 domain-containing protein n=2 Tax=Pedobacter suwonensis TaxID=332999 RepID=A0A1I0SYW6_9SPHI|nr:Protein of unknown function [Pedobacter suwonensis]